MSLAQNTSFLYKFPGQRKLREWTGMKMKNGELMMQADDCITVFNPDTRVGRLCLRGYTFLDLSLRGKEVELPQDFVDEATKLAKIDVLATVSGGAVRIA